MNSLTTPTSGVSATATTRTLSFLPRSPRNFTKTSQLFTSQKRNHHFKVICQAKDGEQNASRRNLLIGLGGLYCASSLANDSFALVAPVSPDFPNCHPANLSRGARKIDCCPPVPTAPPVDFKVPRPSTLCVRPAACLTDKTYMAKYERDILMMKGPPPNDVAIPWLNSRPTPLLSKAERQLKKLAVSKVADNQSPQDIFPAKLDKAVKVIVKRPNKKRSKQEKDEKDEILFIQKITLDTDKFVKFDVLINDDDDPEITPENTEFAGSFVNVPHGHGKQIKTNLILSLTEILEDLNAEDDEDILVALVPRVGCGDVTVGGIKIEFD